MLAAYRNGGREDLIFQPDYNVFLAIDFDGTNVYNPHENLLRLHRGNMYSTAKKKRGYKV